MLHSIKTVLIVVSVYTSLLSLIVYSFYYAKPVLLYIEQPHEEPITNQTKPTPEAIKAYGKAEVPIIKPSPEKEEPKPMVIQKIPPEGESDIPSNKTKRGFVTRSIYAAGHNLSAPELCTELGANLRLLIMITSAPDHAAARSAIRLTWGRFAQCTDVAVVFCLGTTPKSEVLSAVIFEEAETYGDIVQGNFIDSYDNLTLKTVSILEWVANYCPRAKFILKTDDDIFLNVPKLLRFINYQDKTQRTIFGKLAKKWKPVRNRISKYYVPENQFSAPIYPDFTTGPAYLLTSDIIHELYDHALDTTYLKLEDVFTTGIVAQSLNIKRVDIKRFQNKRVRFNVSYIKQVISIHKINWHEQFNLWINLLDGRTECK